MNTKPKKKIWGISSVAFIILVMIFISWYYPFSPFSIDQRFTYQPSWETHNGKTYNEEISEFRATYEKDVKMNVEGDNYNATVDRTQYILPIFEQEWLIGTDSKTMDKDQLDRILLDVEQARNTLLDLLSKGDYNKEERGYLVDNIKRFLSLEERIRYIRNGKYFSRSDLQRLLGNLRGEFRAGFDFYTTVFYDVSHKKKS
ncbi:hypothetical protein ORD22_06305 [Sporosarcina sp. GW1-11]|uniref:hypothetical protein n=1 Tax=Sporosarcina sp. GW1-11 TaxID=2899126 RepID=UPI00294EB726|nr:hypothetical protein [Sporosarcina sp. GW1-11]MDV6377873.1 hypothetical protein [Sporosarcina sp. GW1-11]